MTKVYFLQTLCVSRDQRGRVVEKFIESGMVFKTDVGIVVCDEHSNDLDAFKTMKDMKLSFVHYPYQFNDWCKLTYLGEL